MYQIGCTFRDFTGTENDALQLKFLKSLQRQTCGEFRLVVTTFGEKNVRSIVSDHLGDRAVFFEAEKPEGARYTHTSVLANALSEAGEDDGRWGWTTVDIELNAELVERAAEFAQEGENAACTAYPHIVRRGRTYHRYFRKGFDLFLVKTGADILARIRDDVLAHPNVDWGLFENFICALLVKYDVPRVNLADLAPIVKHENDRRVVNEPPEWMQRSWDKNMLMLRRFMRENNSPRKLIHLDYCGSLFAPGVAVHGQYAKYIPQKVLNVGIRARRMRKAWKAWSAVAAERRP